MHVFLYNCQISHLLKCDLTLQHFVNAWKTAISQTIPVLDYSTQIPGNDFRGEAKSAFLLNLKVAKFNFS